MLYIVPTPIGNLEDITYRSVRILEEVDVILAEDTRISKRLLAHYNITTPLKSYHAHNEHKATNQWINELQKGANIALISDAGTPGISDPGYLLIRDAIAANVKIDCLPGATAFVPALLQSGFANSQFLFAGFLPHKKGRKTQLENLAKEPRTIILYESTHRILKLLEEIKTYFGEERKISISRELTKKFEETFRGNAADAIAYYKEHSKKGEFVVVIGRAN